MSEGIKRTAAQTAVLMAILTLGSKVLGFIREMVMANFFGTSYVVDAYVMAVAIPGMIGIGFFSAIDSAYMPLFSKITENEGKAQGYKFTSETINLLLLIAIAFFVFSFIFSQQLVQIFASGFTDKTAELTSFFLRISFAYAIFTSVSGILESFLKYKGVFLTPLLIGYIQNIIVIGVIIASFYINSYLLIWGWMMAYIVRLLLVWIIAKRYDFEYSANFKLNKATKDIMKLSVPVFIGSYINQINVFVDKTLASHLREGSIAALNYGNLLVNMVIGLTVTVMMIIIYPKMTQAQSTGNHDTFNNIVSTGFNLICLIIMPCSMGTMLYSHQIVQIVYERGNFDSLAVTLTSGAFFYYAIGMIFVSLNALLIQTYYSMHEMKEPMVWGLIGVLINIVLNLILVKYMAHEGLALSTSIAAACNTMLLCYRMHKKFPNVQMVSSINKVGKIFCISLFTMALSKLFYIMLKSMVWMPQMVLMGVVVLVSAVVYFILLKIFRIEEVNMVREVFRIK